MSRNDKKTFNTFDFPQLGNKFQNTGFDKIDQQYGTIRLSSKDMKKSSTKIESEHRVLPNKFVRSVMKYQQNHSNVAKIN